MSLRTSSRAILCSYSSDSEAKDVINKINPPLYPITGQKFEDEQGCAVKNFEATEGKEFVDLDSSIESNDDASELDLDEPDDKTIGICLPPLTFSNKKHENGECETPFTRSEEMKNRIRNVKIVVVKNFAKGHKTTNIISLSNYPVLLSYISPTELKVR